MWNVSIFHPNLINRIGTRLCIPVRILIVALLITSCAGDSNEGQKKASVFIRRIQVESISDILNYPARVRARVNSTILSETDGIISQVFVTLGKKVNIRQTLMVLNHTDPVYQYAPVQIRAPIQGIVSAIDVTQGSHVIQGQKLAAVINPSQLEIQVEIPAQDLALVKKGMTGEFKIPGQESPLAVQVLGVSPFVDPNTGTALAQLEIMNIDHPILSPGLQGQVIFKANQHEGFIIPDSAILYKGKESYIHSVENKKVKRILVTLGAKQRGNVEILKGLTSGVDLVERSSRFVAEGEEVTIENSPGNSAGSGPSETSETKEKPKNEGQK